MPAASRVAVAATGSRCQIYHLDHRYHPLRGTQVLGHAGFGRKFHHHHPATLHQLVPPDRICPVPRRVHG
jgi:hypothetical protein